MDRWGSTEELSEKHLNAVLHSLQCFVSGDSYHKRSDQKELRSGKTVTNEVVKR